MSDGSKSINEFDWSTVRRRKDFEGALRIAVPLGEDLIVSLGYVR